MSAEELTLNAAQGGDEQAFAKLIDPYRRELRAHCYRMAGSLHDADDLLQDSLLRAWRALPRFERRSSLRTWLYRVTTTACLDALEKKSARVLPAEMGPAMKPGEAFGAPRQEAIWLEPCPADFYADHAGDALTPEARVSQRQSVGLAFLVALQLLPPKQRAVLILRDVLGWQASECGELLDLSEAAINSALQRARETLSARAGAMRESPPLLDNEEVSGLLSRYMRAWEMADVNALVALLHEDATMQMPPFEQWVSGREAIAALLQKMVFAPSGPNAFRYIRTEANGQHAVAGYKRDPASGVSHPYALHLLTLREGTVAAIDAFLDPSLVTLIGLPAQL